MSGLEVVVGTEEGLEDAKGERDEEFTGDGPRTVLEGDGEETTKEEEGEAIREEDAVEILLDALETLEGLTEFEASTDIEAEGCVDREVDANDPF